MLIVTSVCNDFSTQQVQDFARRNNLNLLIYQKDDNLRLGEEVQIVKEERLEIVKIPNYGRCDFAFFYYIIKHYDSLPERVLFTKANYFQHNINLDRSVQDKYKYIFMGTHVKYVKYNSKIPHRYDIEIEDQTMSLRDVMFKDSNGLKNLCSFDFYKMAFGDMEPPQSLVVNFGHGPCFACSKEIIQRHPIELYKRFLELFYNEELWTYSETGDKKSQYIDLGKRYHDNLQRFWTVLFTHGIDSLQCETDHRSYTGYY